MTSSWGAAWGTAWGAAWGYSSSSANPALDSGSGGGGVIKEARDLMLGRSFIEDEEELIVLIASGMI